MQSITFKGMILRCLWGLCSLVSVVSCDRSYVCNSYQPVPVEGWESQDTITLLLDTVYHGGSYNVSVGIRSTHLYPYQCLWLLAELELNSPDTLIIDTLVCNITDAEGNFIGKGLSVYDNVYPMATINCKKGQSGRMRLRHIMRLNPLPGISDVGVVMEKSL